MLYFVACITFSAKRCRYSGKRSNRNRSPGLLSNAHAMCDFNHLAVETATTQTMSVGADSAHSLVLNLRRFCLCSCSNSRQAPFKLHNAQICIFKFSQLRFHSTRSNCIPIRFHVECSRCSPVTDLIRESFCPMFSVLIRDVAILPFTRQPDGSLNLFLQIAEVFVEGSQTPI